ncbi:hypothetical protein evm_013396 [Chilo suppressalis]|nr:hypothetical protein evm_013396 [Chilo suppressalis]
MFVRNEVEDICAIRHLRQIPRKPAQDARKRNRIFRLADCEVEEYLMAETIDTEDALTLDDEDQSFLLEDIQAGFSEAIFEPPGPSGSTQNPAMNNTITQAIDEHMVNFKGHNIMRQYMQNKPIKRGFKMWCRDDIYSSSIYILEKRIQDPKKDWQNPLSLILHKLCIGKDKDPSASYMQAHTIGNYALACCNVLRDDEASLRMPHRPVA